MTLITIVFINDNNINNCKNSNHSWRRNNNHDHNNKNNKNIRSGAATELNTIFVRVCMSLFLSKSKINMWLLRSFLPVYLMLQNEELHCWEHFIFLCEVTELTKEPKDIVGKLLDNGKGLVKLDLVTVDWSDFKLIMLWCK